MPPKDIGQIPIKHFIIIIRWGKQIPKTYDADEKMASSLFSVCFFSFIDLI